MLPKSSLATETALSIFSSASRSVSSIIATAPPATRECLLARPGRLYHNIRGSPGPIRNPAIQRPAAARPDQASGSGLANLEAGEPLDVNTGRLEDLGDRLLVVLHERLLGEHDVLVEATDPALDDLR